MTDTYYSLKEAIKVKKPSVAIVETFTLNDYYSHKLKAGTLSDQFKSFSARKNISQKLLSTPVLFASENYMAAWSTTIRNHSFIFTDTAQIQRNIALRRARQPDQRGLYLGRFIRFTSGIEDSTLVKYDKRGFKAYEFSRHMPSEEALTFLEKTIRLCEKHDVKLVLLTLPMYHRHVHDYEGFKKELSELVGSRVKWLDMQLPYDTLAFTPECFENTVAENQHMTYYGSQVAAYKLANFLTSYLPGSVPDRSADIRWKQLFYGSDGYFENHSPENDGVSKVLLANTLLPNGVKVKELILVPAQGAQRLMLKLENDLSKDFLATELVVDVEMQMGDQRAVVPIVMRQSNAIQPHRHVLLLSDFLDARVSIHGIVKVHIDIHPLN